jgi:hypothetical protein
LVAGLKVAGFPASVSQTAGTFVCNQVFYGLQHALAGQGVHSGFMHLPLLPEQAAHWPGPSLPSWPVALQVAGVRQALALLVAHRQQGMRDFAFYGWIGLFAPRGTPPEVVSRINTALNAAIADPAARDRMTSRGDEPGGGTAAEMGRIMAEDYARWGAVVRANNIRVES